MLPAQLIVQMLPAQLIATTADPAALRHVCTRVAVALGVVVATLLELRESLLLLRA